jgi:hypothetical protein
MFKYASHFTTSSRVHKYIFFCQVRATVGAEPDGNKQRGIVWWKDLGKFGLNIVCNMNRSQLAFEEQVHFYFFPNNAFIGHTLGGFAFFVKSPIIAC